MRDILTKLRSCYSGELFDAWQNRRLAAHERVLAALRARFFLHTWRSYIEQMAEAYPDLYRTSRSFISSASFNIFNRLCDSLVMLVLAYARFYPEQPFCPWLLGTEFVEHFFGLARTLLPDFTYGELLKLVKHVMLRQHILLSGKLDTKKERTSRAGYILDYDTSPLTPSQLDDARVQMPDDLLNRLVELAYTEATEISNQLLYLPIPALPLSLTPLRPPNPLHRRGKKKVSEEAAENEPDSDDDDPSDQSDIDEEDEDDEGESEGDLGLSPSESSKHVSGSPGDVQELSSVTADAARYAARYAALSEDFEDCLSELPPAEQENAPVSESPPPADNSRLCSTSSSTPFGPQQAPQAGSLHLAFTRQSRLLDSDGKIDPGLMIKMRSGNQSGTPTRSERVVALDPKFALARLRDPEAKLSSREASHRIRVVQELAVGPKKPKTAREKRWQATAKLLETVISEDGE